MMIEMGRIIRGAYIGGRNPAENFEKYFHIGTIEKPVIMDSHGHSDGRWKGNWSANCINHWVASLGNRLNAEKAIRYHLIICLHELTHALGEIAICFEPQDWDGFLNSYILEWIL